MSNERVHQHTTPKRNPQRTTRRPRRERIGEVCVMAVLGGIGIMTLLLFVQAVLMGLATAQSSSSTSNEGTNNYTSPGVYPARNTPASREDC
jgi:hypothetical protein